MRKFPVLLLTLALLLSFAGCGRKEERVSFQAVVSSVENGAMLVTPAEGSRELRSADCFYLPLQDGGAEMPEVGDLIEIAYSGEIMESYPAQLGGIYSITVIQRAGEREN